MKKFFGSLTAVLGVSFALCASQADEAKFNSSIKHVDMGGEMLSYQTTAGLQKLVDKVLPKAMEFFLKNAKTPAEEAATARQAVKSIRKLVNIGAIQAVASSSKEVSSGIFVTKCFTLIDRSRKSILVNPAAANGPMRWRKLPANTVIAAQFQLNLPHAWKMIEREIRTNPDAKIRSLAGMIDEVKNSAGIDVDKLVEALCGDVSFAIAGTSREDLAAIITIPDKNGYITAQLKTLMPPQEGKNSAVFPSDFGNVTVAYLPGRITAALRPEAFSAPAKTLGSVPAFQRYARYLPDEGNSFFILNFSEELIGLVKKLAESEKEVGKLLDMLEPVSMAVVGTTSADGAGCVAVSNFSIPQLIQCYAFIAPAATLFPALNTSRNRAKSIKCTTDMKQFALALAMYESDHSDALPKTADELHKGKYISEEICDDVIYLGAGWKMSRIENPSTTPVAICDQSNHDDDEVHVAFADGHVESVKVPEDAGLRDIIGLLGKKYNFKPALLDDLLKKAAAYEDDDDED